jgi:hypothetical protein
VPFKKQQSEVRVTGTSNMSYNQKRAREKEILEEHYRFPKGSEKHELLMTLVRLSKVLRAHPQKESEEYLEILTEVVALRKEVNQLLP